MKPKYIKFKEVGDTGKTKIFDVIPTEDTTYTLGQVKWYSPWRKYCYFPYINTIYCPVCLGDIINFIKELMDERKNDRIVRHTADGCLSRFRKRKTHN